MWRTFGALSLFHNLYFTVKKAISSLNFCDLPLASLAVLADLLEEYNISATGFDRWVEILVGCLVILLKTQILY